MSTTADARVRFSQDRLDQLRRAFADLPGLKDFPELTIFSAGSYGRLEASQHSDIDMFFLVSGDKSALANPRTRELNIFGKIIDIVEGLGFPQFSNDCEYLVFLHSNEILKHLGGPTDDQMNYFTARMLLLLESSCLYGHNTYDSIIREIIDSYFKDFPDHPSNFQATFLLNDICRYWKTLLLNYENKRNLRTGDEIRKIKQKVRNFKLKYSRMTTCFATIAALGSLPAPVSQEQVISLTRLTPRQRLEGIPSRVPAASNAVGYLLEKYSAFLELTGLPTSELEAHFKDKAQRRQMFTQANEYGDAMFELLRIIDETDSELRLLRQLVV
ncbi:MAG TPA: hypothetical protein VFA43_13725 [Gemmatimonadaceae bacterium]|nr:hypothetical protein [Gemmatimonadaceae bacterium]